MRIHFIKYFNNVVCSTLSLKNEFITFVNCHVTSPTYYDIRQCFRICL